MKDYEIVERSSGYWIVDGEGYSQGPYDSIEDCYDDIPPEADVQHILPNVDKDIGLFDK